MILHCSYHTSAIIGVQVKYETACVGLAVELVQSHSIVEQGLWRSSSIQ